MKKVFLSLLVVGFAVSFSACGKKEAKPVETQEALETPATVETPAAPVAEKTAEEVAFLAVVEKLDAANKCIVCHQVEVKTVGPSYREVAKVYKEKGGNIVNFLKGKAQPIVDPAQYELMKPNLEKTKLMSGDDLATIAAYIRSLEQ